VVFYIARRIVSALSVILVTLVASFALFYLAPSDPVHAICGARCTPTEVAQITHSLHLDDPKSVQVVHYVEGLFVGQSYNDDGSNVECSAPCLGFSYTLDQPVTDLIGNALPITVCIVLGAVLIFLPVGIGSGVIAARNRGKALDRIMVVGTQGLSSIPYFIVALIVALYFTFLPEAGWFTQNGPGKWVLGLIGPCLTLGFFNSATYTRYSRAAMIESLTEDYTRTARAKGISDRRVVLKHALRATLTPIATIFGLDLAFQLAGSIFTEQIFGLNGLGVITLRAFGQSDLPVLMGTTIVGATFLVVANLIVDIVYTFLDPRVRLS